LQRTNPNPAGIRLPLEDPSKFNLINPGDGEDQCEGIPFSYDIVVFLEE